MTDADANTVYWRPNQGDDHKPYRVVRANAGNKGVDWKRACQHAGCTTAAAQAVKGGVYEFCMTHGGHCPCGHAWTTCLNCNPNVTKMANCCSTCGNGLALKRRESKGGNGYCFRCEAHANAEAAENGSAPLAKGKSWEDYVLDALIPRVVDAEGNVIVHEMRDDLRNMLGSNKRRNRGECSTNHQRRPDLLYVVRDAEARIVAALLVEVDEHSHNLSKNYTSACEAGKIDETFQCILQLAQTEGKARLAAARTEAVRTPYVLFLKINPNACDAPGGSISLDVRIDVLVRMVNEFLNTPYAEFHELADAGACVLPHVQCLYYHSKQGGEHLAYFDAHARDVWDWIGNSCPRA